MSGYVDAVKKANAGLEAALETLVKIPGLPTEVFRSLGFAQGVFDMLEISLPYDLKPEAKS